MTANKPVPKYWWDFDHVPLLRVIVETDDPMYNQPVTVMNVDTALQLIHELESGRRNHRDVFKRQLF